MSSFSKTLKRKGGVGGGGEGTRRARHERAINGKIEKRDRN